MGINTNAVIAFTFAIGSALAGAGGVLNSIYTPKIDPLMGLLLAGHIIFIGIKLVRHPRDFFYFEPESAEKISDALPRIAVFSFILIDHAANQGRPIEEYLLGQHFLVSKLPHFGLDRYAAMLRQVEIEDSSELQQVLKNMERYGWVKFVGADEFRILRPFHRVFDKCLELTAAESAAATSAAPTDEPPIA